MKRRIENTKKEIMESDIDEKNKELILNFDDEIKANGLTFSTRRIRLMALKKLVFSIKKPLTKLEKKDLVEYFSELEESLEPLTVKIHKVSVKRFFKWLNGNKEYPDVVDWIKVSNNHNKNKLPEELLTKEEIKNMIELADNPRDKALIALLYDSGCRAGELLSLRIKHIQFDRYGAKVTIEGKTGMRRIRIVNSSPYVQLWIEHHPDGDNPEAPLFVTMGYNRYGNLISESSLRSILKKWAKKAGIKKRIYPHLFRHSKATHMAKLLTEAHMRIYFGWSKRSPMTDVYVNLSGGDVEERILEIHNIVEKKEDKLEPKKCERCKHMNPATAKFCYNCSLPFDQKTAMMIDNARESTEKKLLSIILNNDTIRNEIKQEIMKDPETLRALIPELIGARF